MNETTPNPLKELLGKSWNLELLISGAAIVFAANLPDWVEDAYYFQAQYVSYEVSNPFSTLPILAYAFFKVVAWMLIGALVAHLLMRALWVAMVGLMAAYPDDIRYDHLPNINDATRRLYEKKLGPMQGFIQRLDKTCNQVLALAFLNALMSITIGIVYHGFFWASQWAKGSLNEATMDFLLTAFSVLLVGIAAVTSWFNFRSKKSDNEQHKELVAKMSWFLNSFLLNVLHKPVYYLSLTFMSNISARRYYVALTVISLIFMTSVMMVFTGKIGEIRHASLLEVRDYYSSGRPEKRLKENCYDNLRPASGVVPSVSIQSDVLDGDPFLKVFVAYPVYLDEILQLKCPLPVLPDTLKKSTERIIMDSLRIDCVRQVFKLSINDSVYQQLDWMFAEKEGRISIKGWQAYIPTTSFKPGKNMLVVQLPAQEKPDSLRVYGQAPFWFKPE